MKKEDDKKENYYHDVSFEFIGTRKEAIEFSLFLESYANGAVDVKETGCVVTSIQ